MLNHAHIRWQIFSTWLTAKISLISWFLPQVFAIIASMEFIYGEAPRFMKSFAMGIYYFVQAIGDIAAVRFI